MLYEVITRQFFVPLLDVGQESFSVGFDDLALVKVMHGSTGLSRLQPGEACFMADDQVDKTRMVDDPDALGHCRLAQSPRHDIGTERIEGQCAHPGADHFCIGGLPLCCVDRNNFV